jgi:hypothetical protein
VIRWDSGRSQSSQLWSTEILVDHRVHDCDQLRIWLITEFTIVINWASGRSHSSRLWSSEILLDHRVHDCYIGTSLRRTNMDLIEKDTKEVIKTVIYIFFNLIWNWYTILFCQTYDDNCSHYNLPHNTILRHKTSQYRLVVDLYTSLLQTVFLHHKKHYNLIS